MKTGKYSYVQSVSRNSDMQRNKIKARIKYKSAAEAENAAVKLPILCKWKVVRTYRQDAYLEVPEEYKDYVMRYLAPEK
jgi:hypothetical protein